MNTQTPHQTGGPPPFDRDREMDERHRTHQQHNEEMAHRERERERERERGDLADRAHRERYATGAPHHSSAGSIPIHQPVASRISGAIHSPGGLLANHGSPNPSLPLGAPSGPVNNFTGGPLHNEPGRPIQHASQSNVGTQQQQQQQQQQLMFNGPPHTAAPPGGPPGVFGGPLPQQQPPQPQQLHPQPQSQQPPLQQQQHPDAQRSQQASFGPINPSGPPPPAPQGQGAGGPQGQQPILNDALTYLDLVKVQFHDQSNVYNRFLDIMKDFKSQSIDTPGVINRVSELFAGHPSLIQGFNTFLPPGYRIECGPGNDPNTIRVTTPMGTTVQTIAGRGTQMESATQPGPSQHFFPGRANNGWNNNAHESPEQSFNHPVENGAGGFGPGPQQNGPYDIHSPGSNNLPRTGPIPGAPGSNAPVPRNVHTPTPVSSLSHINAAAQQANMERRGPVEFNHAISYVNKIKNRFQDKPEIYKQFLDILQTYQREQKPIQDVYAQVTTLFHTAPDLLEDFKQFLPETAGQPKSTPVRASDEEANASAGAQLSAAHQTPQQAPRDVVKMPPIGSFAPPASVSKDNKKRSRIEKPVQPAPSPIAESNSASRIVSGTNPTNKKPKLNHKMPTGDTPMVEPTLTPVVPEPYPASALSASNKDEIAFFEKVKKFVGNKATFIEFLKVCNLFNQAIIDRPTLYHKGCIFISGSPELMLLWKSMVGTTTQDVVVNNRPAPPIGKVSLSNCRGYGPSYRLLPAQEKLKPCSGRDELCNSVLNDEWASHPTWASEDSGFVAHRKNAFEEGLHRIEEERHDYDFYIETNLKCIQLLEPIAQQMLVMSATDRESFHMPTALAGQSISIFKRVCKKIYGKEKAPEVVNDLFLYPFDVVPILLTRMKQMDETWRYSQREWEKLWHTQTQIMYLKSLDHQGNAVKQFDKKTLSAKHLVDVIKTKAEEQRRERSLKGKSERHQFVWDFADKDLITDMLRLLLIFTQSNSQNSHPEKERLAEFFESFVPSYFELNEEKVQERLPKLPLDSGDEDMEEHIPVELTNGRSRRNGAGKHGDLLRGVLDPGRNGSSSSRAPRGQKEDSAPLASKETTPDVGSANEEDMPDAPEDTTLPDISNERWMPEVPRAVVLQDSEEGGFRDEDLKADVFFQRPWYNFFCNQTIFVFFNVFHVLYKRMKEVKESQESVSKMIRSLTVPKPAREIELMDDVMSFFEASDQPSTFWAKTMELIEDYLNGDVDENRYQDVLRHYYLPCAWKIYTIQDLLKTLSRLALTCTSADSKEKTPDLIQQYVNNREKDETSYNTEIGARKFAEKCVKDGEVFVLTWFPAKTEIHVRWLQRDDTTFHVDEMQIRDRWQYYISSYIRVEPTEGVPRARLRKTVLARNLPSPKIDEADIPKPVTFKEGLTISVCVRSSKMVFQPGTSEYFVYDNSQDKTDEELEHTTKLRELSSAFRAAKLTEKFVTASPWIKDTEPAEVERITQAYADWVGADAAPAAEPDEPMANAPDKPAA